MLERCVAAIGNESPVTAVMRAFHAQVAAGETKIRLRLGPLDTVALVHLSEVLRALNPWNGRTRCHYCGGEGDVPVPDQVMRLAGVFERRYSLSQLGDPERQPYLDLHADPVVRARKAAQEKAEHERRKAARDREEAAYAKRARILPGDVAEGEPGWEPRQAPAAEFMPASAGRESS
jgi:hypothetical protein